MEALLNVPKYSALWAWSVLMLAAIGTYAWRGLGILLSGKLSQDSPMFRWVSCVAYAMVASLVIRIIVLPVGVLAQVPLSYRLIAAGVALRAGPSPVELSVDCGRRCAHHHGFS